MRFERTLKPELFISKDTTRPHLTKCYLDTEDKRIYATDGHRLIALPVRVEPHDVSGWITAEAIAAARKLGKECGDVAIEANGALKTGPDASGPAFPRPRYSADYGESFPPVKQVMQRPTGQKVTIGVDARYLADAQKALGSNGIELTIYLDEDGKPTLDPMFVTHSSQPGAEILVMPMRV